ncbi:MAG: RusA family crossover junction endodeoxyribonuclease [Nitrososphaerales archaeon]|nr:RusA family crossover junction endodeoxyribonuclease [Nitrososphaerales archaeon]
MAKLRQFEVLITPFQPLSLRGNKGRRYAQKEALRKEILKRIGEDELKEFSEEYRNKLVKVSLVFFLWKGSPGVTDTRWKKDLDNLVKPVLDVLQQHLDSQKTKLGLNLFENDDYVCVLHAAKKLAAKPKDEGIHIVVSDIRDDEMLRLLEGRESAGNIAWGSLRLRRETHPALGYS